MAKINPNQYSGKYFGLLIFKYKLRMLTRKEKKILSAWRKLPVNEELFQELINPENILKGLQEMEEQQILIRKRLRQTFPDLPELSKN